MAKNCFVIDHQTWDIESQEFGLRHYTDKEHKTKSNRWVNGTNTDLDASPAPLPFNPLLDDKADLVKATNLVDIIDKCERDDRFLDKYPKITQLNGKNYLFSRRWWVSQPKENMPRWFQKDNLNLFVYHVQLPNKSVRVWHLATTVLHSWDAVFQEIKNLDNTWANYTFQVIMNESQIQENGHFILYNPGIITMYPNNAMLISLHN